MRDLPFSVSKNGFAGIAYDSLPARLSEMEEYKGKTETELQEIAYDETIAEMSETILTDTDAANRLSQEIYKQDRTLWQKIKDFFTGLVEKLRSAYKDSDPDSDIGRILKQAVRDNEQIAQAWAEAVSEAGENYQLQDGQKKNAREGVRYSLRGTTDGQTVAVVDEDILSNIDLTQWNKQTKKKVQAAAKEALKKFSDGIVVDGITRNVNRVSRREFTASEYSEMLSKKAPQLFADKMRTAGAIDDVVIATTDWARDGKLKHPRTDNFVDFDHGKVLIKAGENQYSAEVVVGITDNGTAVFYDVVDIQPAHFEMQKEKSPTDVTTNKSPDVIHGDSSGDTVPQQAAEVKGNVRYSSRTDSTGHTLSEAQAKYFENSEVRDENGNLLPVYHRTDSDFYTFDRNRLGGNALGNATDAAMAATALIGHWFSDHDVGDALGGRAIQSYVNIENPYSTSLAELAEEIRSHAENAEQMQDDYDYGDYATTRQAADAFVDWLRGNGYDGLIVTDEEFGGNSYVVLDSEQAKLTTNETPTGSGDIRYSDRNSQSKRVEQLEKKNAELKAEAEYLKQVVKIQKSGNKVHILDRNSVNAIGKGLMESVNAKGSEFGKMLNDFYRTLGTEEMSYETMQDKAGELAEWLLEHR